MPNIYNNTTWNIDEKPTKSKKFATWNTKLSNTVSLVQKCVRETYGTYGVLPNDDPTFSKVFLHDDGATTFYDRTNAIRRGSTGTPPYYIPPIIPNGWAFAVDDEIYLGLDRPFNSFKYYTNVQAAGGTTVSYHWFRRSEGGVGVWTELPTGVPTGTKNFSAANSTVAWNYYNVEDWITTSMKEIQHAKPIVTPTTDYTQLYYIRITFTLLPGALPTITEILTNPIPPSLKVIAVSNYQPGTSWYATRQVDILPGRVMLNGVIYELDTILRVGIPKSWFTGAYYGAIVIDTQGYLYFTTRMEDNALPVLTSPDTVKLCDILLDATGTFTDSEITDTRYLLS